MLFRTSNRDLDLGSGRGDNQADRPLLHQILQEPRLPFFVLGLKIIFP